jgi:GT2 family glycosyltransferase
VNYPKVFILILNWNGLEHIIECLESLKKITYPNYEVIVIDNNSEGNDVEVLKEKYGDYIHIIENNKNYGFAEGNNIGMRFALGKTADYILVLNIDTVVDPEFLSELVKASEKDERIGIVQPQIYSYYQPDKLDYHENGLLDWATFYLGMPRIRLLLGKGQFERVRYLQCISLGCALIKRRVLESVGLLDPVYFIGGYDNLDFSHRATKSGFKLLYLPTSKIWHKGSPSISKKSPLRWRDMAKNKIVCARKNLNRPQYIAFIVCLFTLQIPKWLLHAAVVSKGVSLTPAILRGIRDGFTAEIVYRDTRP